LCNACGLKWAKKMKAEKKIEVEYTTEDTIPPHCDTRNNNNNNNNNEFPPYMNQGAQNSKIQNRVPHILIPKSPQNIPMQQIANIYRPSASPTYYQPIAQKPQVQQYPPPPHQSRSHQVQEELLSNDLDKHKETIMHNSDHNHGE
jgi:hypothetical protein